MNLLPEPQSPNNEQRDAPRRTRSFPVPTRPPATCSSLCSHAPTLSPQHVRIESEQKRAFTKHSLQGQEWTKTSKNPWQAFKKEGRARRSHSCSTQHSAPCTWPSQTQPFKSHQYRLSSTSCYFGAYVRKYHIWPPRPPFLKKILICI